MKGLLAIKEVANRPIQFEGQEVLIDGSKPTDGQEAVKQLEVAMVWQLGSSNPLVESVRKIHR